MAAMAHAYPCAREVLPLPLQGRKGALYVLPYDRMVVEKAASLKDILGASGCDCKGFYGSGPHSIPLQPGYVEQGFLVSVYLSMVW